MRPTLAGLTPTRGASVRVLQCVPAPAGGPSSVRRTTSASFSGVIVPSAPGRGKSVRTASLNDPNFGSRMRGEGEYANQLAALFRAACRKAGLNGEDLPPLSTDHFRRPHDPRAARIV